MAKRYRLDPSQALTEIVRAEDAQAVAALQHQLQGMEYNARVDYLVKLFAKAKQDSALIPILKRAVSGRFLLELQDAQKKYLGHELRTTPPAQRSAQKLVSKPDVMSTEEMRKKLGGKFRISNPIKDDAAFITDVLLPKFGVKAIRLKHSNSKSKWPDIWVELKQVPVITVTDEWMRQDKDERRKRLVHELLHVRGMSHGRVNGLMYSSRPETDTYSKAVYQSIVRTT